MINPRRAILAIDAGGSTTRCALVGDNGTVYGVGRGGPANHILSGWETARASLQQATSEAMRLAGIRGERVNVVAVGSAGVGSNGEGREVVESLLAELVPNAGVVRATGDMVAAFWGALRTPVGVVVSAGTGSVCYGRNARGVSCQVGGWGHVMGDEGSAYDIATRALRAVARAADGRSVPTAMTGALGAALDVTSAIGIALRVYGEPLSRERLAALAAEVAAVARTGDPTALGILRLAGEELGIAAGAALHNLELLDSPVVVSFAGSVFAAGDLVMDSFRGILAAANSRARIEPPLLPPVGGAYRLGMADLGESVGDDLLERVREELSRCEL